MATNFAAEIPAGAALVVVEQIQYVPGLERLTVRARAFDAEGNSLLRPLAVDIPARDIPPAILEPLAEALQMVSTLITTESGVLSRADTPEPVREPVKPNALPLIEEPPAAGAPGNP